MLASIALALSSAWAHGPQVPVLTYVSGGEHPVISDAQRAASGGILGFEGGRVVKQQSDGSYWLFTAEFKGPPVNANMRIAIWRANNTAAAFRRKQNANSAQSCRHLSTWAAGRHQLA